MRKLGTICRLQVQRESLKQGDRANRVYDPAGIVEVPALRVEPGGAIGLTATGEIRDIHHADHPASRNRGGLNGISVNVTGNYAVMTARFGPHVALGVAGENIIVQYDELLRADGLGDTLLIRTHEGSMLTLEDVIPAPPCEPFTRYALADDFAPAQWVKETLQFLNDGLRGYYVTVSKTPVVIRPGDEIFIP